MDWQTVRKWTLTSRLIDLHDRRSSNISVHNPTALLDIPITELFQAVKIIHLHTSESQLNKEKLNFLPQELKSLTYPGHSR